VNASDFRKWRRELRYTQREAAQKLGVTRNTVHHWECKVTRIPEPVALACRELTRRSKWRPQFGPVTLVYADESIWENPDVWSDLVVLQCEGYPDNQAAIRRACFLTETHSLNVAFIVEGDGGIVWTSTELLDECDRRRAEKKLIRKALRGTVHSTASARSDSPRTGQKNRQQNG